MKLTLKKSSSGEISPAIIKLAKKEMLIPITNCINKCISIKSLPDELKVPDVIPVLKKKIQITKQTIDQSVYYLQFQKYLREFFLSRLKSFPKKSYQQNCVVLEKAILHNMPS